MHVHLEGVFPVGSVDIGGLVDQNKILSRVQNLRTDGPKTSCSLRHAVLLEGVPKFGRVIQINVIRPLLIAPRISDHFFELIVRGEAEGGSILG